MHVISVNEHGDPVIANLISPFGIQAQIKGNTLSIYDKHSRRNAGDRNISILEIKSGSGSYLDLSWCLETIENILYAIVWINNFSKCIIVSSGIKLKTENVDRLKQFVDEKILSGIVPRQLKTIPLTCKLNYNEETQKFQKL